MCNYENSNCSITLVISLLIGALAGILFFLGIISDPTIALIVILIISLLIFVFLFVISILPRYNTCVRQKGCKVLIGLIGSIFFSIIALSIDLAINVYTALLIGLVRFFISMAILKFLNLLDCVIDYNSFAINNGLDTVNINNLENSNTINNVNENNNFDNTIGNRNLENRNNRVNNRGNSFGNCGCNRNFF